jgi:hypothetical protein
MASIFLLCRSHALLREGGLEILPWHKQGLVVGGAEGFVMIESSVSACMLECHHWIAEFLV